MEYYEGVTHHKYMGQMRTGWQLQVIKYDLLRDYMNTISLEEQVTLAIESVILDYKNFKLVGCMVITHEVLCKIYMCRSFTDSNGLHGSTGPGCSLFHFK